MTTSNSVSQKPARLWSVEMGSIRIVVDNKAADGFVAEHGFALWIKEDEREILFDTGNREALLPNCRRLELNFSSLTDLVLSHGHYDHTGGVDAVVREAGDLQVYLHQAAMQPRYSEGDGETKSVRMPAAAMRSLWQLPEDSIHWLTHPVRISSHMGLSGPISRQTEYEDTGGSFYYDPLAERPDPIEDDNALWIDTAEGLVICVGCSHAGIVNTIRAITDLAGKTKISCVIGGLHLLNSTADRLERTAEALNEFDLRQLVACHCTGDDSYAYLVKHLKCELVQGYAGYCLNI